MGRPDSHVRPPQRYRNTRQDVTRAPIADRVANDALDGVPMIRTTQCNSAARSAPLSLFAPSLAIFACLLFCPPLAMADPASRDLLDKKISLDVAPDTSLEEALIQWGASSGMQVMMNSTVVGDQKTRGIAGTHRAGDALSTLLRGSRLSYEVSDHTVKVTPESMEVAGDQSFRLSQAQPSDSGNSSRTGNTTESDGSEGGPSRGTESKTKKGQGVELEEVVVTGTHIRGEATVSVPIQIDSATIDRSGHSSIGDVIRDLPQNWASGNSPQVTPNFSPGAENESFSGGSTPNLRGLGVTSTLSLVNGRRLASENDFGAVDISLIPLDAVDHIDIVTDGASAIYGADAVAGVVNFVLRKTYDGAKTTASYGTATDGGAHDTRFSQLYGTSWSGGGAVAAYEHEKTGPLRSTQRDFTRDVATVPQAPTLLPAVSRDSIYASAHQALPSATTVSVDALYTDRDNHSVFTYPSTFSYHYDTKVHQYSVNGTVDQELGGGWRASLLASVSGQRDAGVASGSVAETQLVQGRSRTAELQGDGPLFELASGTARMAVGAGYRSENYSLRVPEFPTVIPSAGHRDVRYAFGELRLPLIGRSNRAGAESLDLDISGRYEDYSVFGSEAVPKVTVSYVPFSPLTLRVSAGKSFAAPPLGLQYSPRYVVLASKQDATSPTGSALALIRSGGNPDLRPQTATTLNLGADIKLTGAPDLQMSINVFRINYEDKIRSNTIVSISDPALGPLIIRSPSPALQQSVIAAANGGFLNESGAAYDPAAVAALVDGRNLNVAAQNVDGADATFDYGVPAGAGHWHLQLDTAFLQIKDRLTAQSPERLTSGTIFNPPRWRVRGGPVWSGSVWSGSATLNYLGHSVNIYLPNSPEVASWLTVDAQINYEPREGRLFQGVRVSLSGQNLFDRAPPYILFNSYNPGFHYDPNNASPLGRFITLRLTKEW